MDFLSYLPSSWAPYALGVELTALVLTSAFPAPKSGFLANVWPVLNVLALNIGHAKNAPATENAPHA